IAPGGRIGAKVYYELPGWQPDLTATMLAAAGLPPDPAAVQPEIAGVLRASLARKRRAGLALRVDLPCGSIREGTTVAAFPPAMISRAEMAARVGRWLASEGGDCTTYDAMVARLLPGWPPRGGGVFLSLFTRTRGMAGVANTVYLRPAFPRTPSRVHESA